MKSSIPVILSLLIGFNSCDSIPDNKISDQMKRVLATVEKGTSSFGFYTEDGIRIKTVKLDTFPHEMVFSSDSRFAYVTNNGSLRYRDEVEGGENVSIVDLKKMEKVDEISVLPYKRPHGISMDYETGLLAVSVENPDKVLLINPKTKKIIDEFDCHGDTPHMVKLGPGARQLYIANVLSDDVIIMEISTKEYVKIPVGRGPQGMDFQENRNILFVTCGDYTSVIDVVGKKEINQIPLGANRAVLIKNDSLLLLSASGNVLGFVDAHSYEILYQLPLGYRLFSINCSSDEKYAYLAAEPQNLIFVVSVEERKIVRKIKTPEGTRIDPVKDIWIEGKLDPNTFEGTIHPIPRFERIVLDSTFEKGYQVTSADFNGDTLPDIAAVSDRLPEIYWYENPTWEKHLISNQTRDNIDLAPKDIDGDGDIDLALACGFNLQKSTEGGYLYWLQNEEKGSSWILNYIDSFPTSHRIRWADIDGDKTQELVNLPIIGVGAERDEYAAGAEFSYFIIPDEPAKDSWDKHVIDTALHMAHGLQVVRWDAALNSDILTASFDGIHLFQWLDGSWNKKQLGAGDPCPRPAQGASEVGLGHLDGLDKPFIATIEPWHGDKVVYYTAGPEGALWNRHVIDTTFRDGHALLCADLTFDGSDEIIAGHRGSGYNLYIYQYDKTSRLWIRHDLDRGGISAAGIFLLDFDDDGFLDIAACGSATNNVVLYRNLGYRSGSY